MAAPFVQSFRYDSLNRLLDAKETNNGQQTWHQTSGFDRYGNRTSFSQIVGSQQLTIDNTTLPQVDANSNRFSAGQGYEYDSNGNLITDAQNRHFHFNGDNKQAEVRDSGNNLIGQYFYDADGKRVKKIAGPETTIFVYDGAGKQIAEYSTVAPSNPTTSYVMTDTHQSVRAISDAQGNITSRRDFLPFGEEIYAGTANRTTAQQYSGLGADNISKRFTGYEKDNETGLDFAEARYYNNLHGRFTAVDPLLASGKSANPQSFNRYVYVMNSPLRLTDHTGLQVGEEVSDSGVISVDVNWFTSFQAKVRYYADKAQQQFNQYMQSASNHDALGSVNFQLSQETFDQYQEGRPNRLVGGIFGPSVRSVIERTNESYRFAESVIHVSLAVISLRWRNAILLCVVDGDQKLFLFAINSII